MEDRRVLDGGGVVCEVGASEVETQGSMVGGLGLVAFEAHSVGLGKAILVGFEVVGVERMKLSPDRTVEIKSGGRVWRSEWRMSTSAFGPSSGLRGCEGVLRTSTSWIPWGPSVERHGGGDDMRGGNEGCW
eukprot:793072-Rhodomonas_salina.1